MGWFFPYGATRSDIISELTPKERFSDDGKTVFRTLRHCCKGNVLYALHESGPVRDTRKWIGVSLMQKSDGSWGYKSMDESMGPSYVSCPVSYLDAADEPVNEYAAKWRAAVRAVAAERSRKKPKVGEVWSLNSPVVPQVEIVEVRGQGLRGEYQGRVYRVPRSILGEKIGGKAKKKRKAINKSEIDALRKMMKGWDTPTVMTIKPGGGFSAVEVDKKPGLDELQKMVGGYIQIVPNDHFEEVYVNEEGKLKGLPPNMTATNLLGIDPNWDTIAGNAVILLNLPDEE